MTTVWIVVAIIAVAIVAFVVMYNKLVKLNVRTNEAWSDIEVQLKRRYNLIPNLVDTVKGYAKHEKTLFTNVTKARTEAMGAKGMESKAEAENQITQALKSIFAVAENYPTLKANENFAKLQDELTDTENKVQSARRFYNGNVREINIAVQSFPTNVVAGMFNFKKRELFELKEEAAKKVPKVDFLEDEKKEPKKDSK